MSEFDQAHARNGTGGGTATAVQERAQDTFDQAKEEAKTRASEISGKAASEAKQKVDERSTQIGEQVQNAASDLREIGDELQGRGRDTPAKLANQIADQVEKVGGYLKSADAERMMRDAEDFGRRKPWAVTAGGVALGFFASRFMRASSSRRFQSSDVGRQWIDQQRDRQGFGTTRARGEAVYADIGTIDTGSGDRSFSSEPAYAGDALTSGPGAGQSAADPDFDRADRLMDQPTTEQPPPAERFKEGN